MEYLEAGRLLYRQSRRYLSDVLPLLREALVSTVALCHIYFRLLIHLLRPVISLLLTLYSLLSPLLSSLLSRLWRFFVQQPARALAAEAAIAIALLALIALERHFQILAGVTRAFTRVSTGVSNRYKACVDAVRRQSRTAAAALPHLLFAALVLAFHRVAGHIVRSQAPGATGLFLAIGKPVWQTLKLLYAVDIEYTRPLQGADDEEEDDQKKELESSPGGTIETLETPTEKSTVRRRKTSTPLSEPYQTRSRTRLQRALEFETENEADEANVSESTPSRVRFSAGGKSEDGDATKEARTPTRQRRGRKVASADDWVQGEASEAAVLRFWVTFGLAWTTRSLAWYFVPGVLQGVIENLDVCLLYVLIWAQLGLTRGADMVYGVVAGAARRRWGRGGTDRTQTANVLVRLAVAANVMRAERVTDMTSTIAESGLALTGVCFLITPRAATFAGTVLIGLVVPVYLTTSVLEGHGSGLGRHNWLAYWAVMGWVEGMFAGCAEVFGWVPLWYHVKMVGILWLQLPYYRGSVVVLDAVMRHVGTALSSVRREVVTPRKRKRA